MHPASTAATANAAANGSTNRSGEAMPQECMKFATPGWAITRAGEINSIPRTAARRRRLTVSCEAGEQDQYHEQRDLAPAAQREVLPKAPQQGWVGYETGSAGIRHARLPLGCGASGAPVCGQHADCEP